MLSLPISRCSRALLAAALLCLGLAPARPARADELVVGNRDPSVRVTGAWSASSATPGFVGPDYLFRVPGDGSASVSWPFPAAAAPGRYELSARWSSGPNRASHATFLVRHAGGTAAVPVNQQAGGGAWQPLGSYEFQPGQGQGVSLSDQADGVVIANAIRWVGPTAGAPASPQAQAIAPSGSPGDPRFFDQTRYRITEDAFWDYFQKRGGTRTFGYPVSNTFTLLGLKVQIFQRQVMQLRPDGGVQTMNILDEGLMPYTRINGSIFPAPDPEVVDRSPRPDEPDYHARALQFVRDMAPDTFDNEPVGFSRTFFSSVRPEEVFPNGVPEGSGGLLSGFNLETWGLPTSRPAHDPTNASFIYQRFQRGIMHYDKGCGCTQGLLLADYLKAIMTNRDLPSDLAEQARGSPLFGQWAPLQPLGLARPADLPGSNLEGAFLRDPVVTLDPGHGGREIGASHTFPDGQVLQEKELNLRVALRLRELLQQAGYQVVMTRTRDAQVNGESLHADLQARVDAANAARSDIFVSVHFNGASNPNAKGTYIFWDPDRPFSNRSKALAELVDAGVVRALREAGYPDVDHGASTDTSILGGGHYYLLSPSSEIVGRPSQMPAIIGEGLFLTNDEDANAIRQDRVVEAVARGYSDGIRAFFSRYPAG